MCTEFFGILWGINLIAHSFAGHHIIFIFVFLVFFLALVLQRMPKGVAVAIIMAMLYLNVRLGYTLVTKVPIYHRDDWSKLKVSRYISQPDFVENHLIVAVDWGIYCMQMLYGNSQQSVIVADYVFDEDILVKMVYKALDESGKDKVAFIVTRPSKNDLEAISREFDGFRVLTDSVLSLEDKWQIYTATRKY